MVEIWRSKKSQWVGCWDVVVGLFDFKLRWTCWWSTWKIRVNKIVRISICLMKMVVANDDHSIDWFLIDYWSSDRAIDIHKWTCKPQNISFLRTCASQNSSINVQVYCGDIGFLPPIKWVPTICTPAMSLFSISKITFHELIGRDAPKREKKKNTWKYKEIGLITKNRPNTNDPKEPRKSRCFYAFNHFSVDQTN